MDKGRWVTGPTWAGAGVGFLLPLTELKLVTIDPDEIATADDFRRAAKPNGKRTT